MTTQDRIRAAGGIVFTDGNITFSSVAQFLAAAQNVPAGWQPIETAPKETLVMVYSPLQADDWPDSVRINFDFICPDYEDWHDHCESREHYMAVGGPNAAGPDCVCTGPSENAPYTHWMPLPAAPDAAHSTTPATGTQEAP